MLHILCYHKNSIVSRTTQRSNTKGGAFQFWFSKVDAQSVPTRIVTSPLISLRPHWYRYAPTDIVTPPLISLRPHWYRYVPTDIVTSPLMSLRPHWYRYVPTDIATSPLISLRPHWYRYVPTDIVTSPLISLRPHWYRYVPTLILITKFAMLSLILEMKKSYHSHFEIDWYLNFAKKH